VLGINVTCSSESRRGDIDVALAADGHDRLEFDVCWTVHHCDN